MSAKIVLNSKIDKICAILLVFQISSLETLSVAKLQGQTIKKMKKSQRELFKQICKTIFNLFLCHNHNTMFIFIPKR